MQIQPLAGLLALVAAGCAAAGADDSFRFTEAKKEGGELRYIGGVPVVALVGSCMNAQVETVSPDTSVIEVAERFLRGGHRHLPVVEEGRLLGEISCHDVLLAVKEFAQHEPGHAANG